MFERYMRRCQFLKLEELGELPAFGYTKQEQVVDQYSPITLSTAGLIFARSARFSLARGDLSLAVSMTKISSVDMTQRGLAWQHFTPASHYFSLLFGLIHHGIVRQPYNHCIHFASIKIQKEVDRIDCLVELGAVV
jgi:hypothetical protein